MALRFLGVDPNSDGDHCPTVWLDELTGDYVLQGWRISDQTTIDEIGPVPSGEIVMRFPSRMAQFFLDAGGGTAR